MFEEVKVIETMKEQYCVIQELTTQFAKKITNAG